MAFKMRGFPKQTGIGSVQAEEARREELKDEAQSIIAHKKTAGMTTSQKMQYYQNLIKKRKHGV
jgi:hypothetical protein